LWSQSLACLACAIRRIDRADNDADGTSVFVLVRSHAVKGQGVRLSVLTPPI
jgi:hypothetical protein